MTYYMMLTSQPNPDFHQTANPAPKQLVSARHLRTLRERARRYRSMFNLGGGNWTDPVVTTRGGHVVGHFSYNLRFWRDCWSCKGRTLHHDGTPCPECRGTGGRHGR